MELLNTLNKEQKQAVTHGEGPLLIVAGAGTGKTTVITRRIAWLIAEGKAAADEIVAVTFTEKAAGEMSERVDWLLPLGYRELWISTFHAFCQRVLQNHAIDIGLPTDITLLDQTAQWLLVREHLNEFNLDYYQPLGNPTKFIHALLKHFSRAKDEAISPKDYLEYVEGLKLNLDAAESTGGGGKVKKARKQESKKQKKTNNQNSKSKKILRQAQGGNGEIDASEIGRLEEVANAYHTYQQILLDNNALDFGDLITYTLTLFKKRPHILNEYRNKFKYILVDEFQDTNWAQYELIKLLAAPNDNITLVGDDEQSIYKFRGASVSNILQFHKDYPQAQFITLTANYRSLQEILDRSHTFIQLNNPHRLEGQVIQGKTIDKKLIAVKKGSATIEYLFYEDQYEEAHGIVEKIVELSKQEKEFSYNNVAVLVRANNHADTIIAALEAASISYIYYASKGLYRKPVIQDIIHFLKLLDNYHESASLWRFLNWPIFNFNEKMLISFNYVAKRKSKSLFSVLELVKISSQYSDVVRSEVSRVLQLIETYSTMALSKKPVEVVYRALNESGYIDQLLAIENIHHSQHIAYLNQFITIIKEYEKADISPTVKGFLRQLDYELESGETGSLDSDLDAGPEAVKVMTIHAAKGLEFEYVFLTNMVDKRFPSIERKDPIALPNALIKEILPAGDIHLQEERRLMYVAMTRAKSKLYVTGARDYGGKLKKKPSRFLYELGFIAKDTDNTAGIQTQKKNNTSVSLRSSAHQSVPVSPKITFALPKKFSYTLLSTFKHCPYQFYLNYILKLPQPGSYHFSFGNTIHLTLQKFFQQYIDLQQHQQADLFVSAPADNDTARLPPIKDLFQLYEESWIDDWYDSEKHQQDYKAHGKKILTHLYTITEKTMPEVMFIEKGFNFKVTDNANQLCTITGKIDRIDKLSDGSLQIIDYKTGRAKDSNYIDKNDKMQLLLYQLAAQEVFNERTSKLSYWYVENNTLATFIGTPEDLQKLKQHILSTIKEIQEADFNSILKEHTCYVCEKREL